VPVEHKEGGIMNPAVLTQVLETVDATAKTLEDRFRFLRVDTSAAAYGSPEQTVTAVLDFMLKIIDEQLVEEILCLPASVVAGFFKGSATLLPDQAARLVEAFTATGEYRGRADVESNPDLVQAIPVVVVRNKSGHVLRLRRRERPDTKSPLHEELVVWAGGHVRREDSETRSAITAAGLRELQEELRLSVEENELRLLGAVYAEAGGTTSRHTALVYEWQAESDDVAVTLSTAEFFERRGTSLSGKFVSLEDLAKDVRSGEMREPWSTEIIAQLLTNGKGIQRLLL
jgi:predicted NUDIX family phosphoesterase